MTNFSPFCQCLTPTVTAPVGTNYLYHGEVPGRKLQLGDFPPIWRKSIVQNECFQLLFLKNRVRGFNLYYENVKIT